MPGDLAVPAVGIEDVDVALFNLFDKEIPLVVDGSTGAKRVPVVFASGEKWALLKRGRALRDKNGSLILPLLTIMRTTVQQLPDDIAGRGINQQTGEIVVRRRLDKTDRAHQNIINRLYLKNQLNVAVPVSASVANQVTTAREIGDLEDDPTIEDGGFLLQDRSNNVFETIMLPTPQFYTAVYDVTVWTQFTQHMNQILEQLVSSFLPQGNAWRLDSPKGYWFVATVDGNLYNAENNFDEMSQEERIVKYRFTVKVPAYVLATDVPGSPVPVKRYVSSPTVSFDLGVGADADEKVEGDDIVDDPFLGSDDPTLPLEEAKNRRRDQRYVDGTRLFPQPGVASSHDPALKSLPRGQAAARYKKISGFNKKGKLVTKYVKVVSTNKSTGETIFAPDTDLGGLTIVIMDD